MKEKIIERLRSTQRSGIEDLINYLENQSDYFKAPASTKFHSNYDGGLAEHSNNVVELLISKNNQFNLNIPTDTIYITGYLHDLCKCNMYNKSIGIKKDEISGKWVGVKTYSINEKVPLGHGEKSVIIAQQFIKLSLEESLMIRWHMGAYLPSEMMKDFHKAIDMYKSVLAINLADEEATTFLETTREQEICDIKVYNEYVRQRSLLESK